MHARPALIARRTALALALLLAVSTGSALAAGKAQVDGRGARAAIQKNRTKAQAKAKLDQVAAIRDSKSGKSVQAIGVTRTGSAKSYQAYNVDKKTRVARRTQTGLLSVGAATTIANSQMRRERAPNAGTFSGVVFEGVTRAGNLKFHSQTDRTQRVFVNPATGKTSTREK